MVPILQLDIAGNPSGWITHRDAINMMACNRVIASLGDNEFVFKGGTNRVSGVRSRMTIGSILLTKERVVARRLAKDYEPPLTNRGLFSRDGYTCLYCGHSFAPYRLTRDHIVPQSRVNDESWTNSATACRKCNSAKGDKTPEEWGQLLLAIPFAPNHAEYLFLRNSHRIIADQQQFLMARFSKDSPLLQ